LTKSGHDIEPVAIAGRAIATTFWGKAWCTHLESLSDFANRLPRGRTYARRGAVLHLGIASGRILAKVQGRELYDIEIDISKLKAPRWAKVVAKCTGSIDSLVELLRGKLSDSVMQAVTNIETGLFPAASEIRMSCSCPDWAGLCKHLAAVLYGVGARLDNRPELLFTLRGVDPSELVAERAAAQVPIANGSRKRVHPTLSSDTLSDVFGIELERTSAPKIRAPAKGAQALPKSSSAAASRKKKTLTSKASRSSKVTRTPEPIPKRANADAAPESTALVLEFIQSHPGLRVELIGRALSVSTRQLVLPIRNLLATGAIITLGTRRATQYFPARGEPSRSGRRTRGGP
jgi:uncharacterized Zn finger protein